MSTETETETETVTIPRAELESLRAELRRLRRELGDSIALARIKAGPGDDVVSFTRAEFAEACGIVD